MTETPERRLPLEGASNFRDLGGYETADGRRVRWRKVFRSGAMDRLSDADLALLSDLGLRTICDLRHPEEQAAPSHAIGDGSAGDDTQSADPPLT